MYVFLPCPKVKENKEYLKKQKRRITYPVILEHHLKKCAFLVGFPCHLYKAT
jgi:hypothetical protein